MKKELIQMSLEHPLRRSWKNRGGGWTVTESRLMLMAKVPGLSDSEIREYAEKAKVGCPISRLLNAKIILEIKPFEVEESRTEVA